MLIDWFTVGAQALNFVVLVWLMKRFLYQPILDAIDAREKTIAMVLADADKKQADAQQARDAFQRKNDDFDRQHATLIDRANKDADAQRSRLFDEARQAAEALSAKRQQALEGDAQRLSQALVQRAQQEVFAVARKALADLATAGLEERMAEVFVSRLRALDGADKDCLAGALRSTPCTATVRSAFEMPAPQRAVIQAAVNETFSAEISLRFEMAPELISGIEFSANGQRVSWSIAGYLASLQNTLGELMTQRAATGPGRQ